MDKGHMFLHNHPETELKLGLDKDHVIVDRDAWERVRAPKPECSHDNIVAITDMGMELCFYCPDCEKISF